MKMMFSKKLTILSIIGLLSCNFVFGRSPLQVQAANESNPPNTPIDIEGLFQIPSGADSHQENNIITITDDVKNQKGAIWSTEQNKLDLTKDFNLSMYIYFGNKGTNAADGMAFVMQNQGPDVIGENAGASLGVWASEKYKGPYNGIAKSFAVEFDLYHNEDFDREVGKNHHVAWHYPGMQDTYIDKFQLIGSYRSLRHNQIAYVNNLSDDTWRKFTVNYKADEGRIQYHLEGVGLIGLIQLNPLSVFGGNEVYWGFVGATGGSSTLQQVSFDEISGLVEGEVSGEFTKQDGTIVTEETDVFSGETLNYTYTTQWLSGIEGWKTPQLMTTINDQVTVVPGTLKVEYSDGSFENLPDSYWENQQLTVQLQNLDSLKDIANLTFQVKVNSVEETTTVFESAKVQGVNLTKYTEELTYHINPAVKIPPEVTLNQEELIEIPWGSDYVISGSWLDMDSESVSLFYELNNGTPIEFASNLENNEMGSANLFEFNVPMDELAVGEHQLTVYALDVEGLKSNEERRSFILRGTLSFKQIPKEVYFENLSLADHKNLANRLGDWEIVVNDSRGGNEKWVVMATLTEEFSDESGHLLTDALIYVDAFGNENIMNLNQGIKVFEHETLDSEDVYLSWDATQGMFMKIKPDAYAGEYAGTLTWTLVDALQ